MKTMKMKAALFIGLITALVCLHIRSASAQSGNDFRQPRTSVKYGVQYKRIRVDGVDIFYREAGNPSRPTILLLHGFPASSFMFRDLIGDLAGKYHLIAPDNPGSGYSSHPSPDEYEYTFDHLSQTIEKFIDTLHLRHLNFYMQDFGGPIGFRIISRRPELVNTLLIQNTNIYEEGLGPDVQEMIQMGKDNDLEGLKRKTAYDLSPDGIKAIYTNGVKDSTRISADPYTLDNCIMQSPGVKDIQGRLMQNYPTNFPLYPSWQKYLRDHQPPALVIWGGNDRVFSAAGAKAYRKDLRDTEVHVFDGGHFVLEEYHEQAALYIDQFLKKHAVGNF